MRLSRQDGFNRRQAVLGKGVQLKSSAESMTQLAEIAEAGGKELDLGTLQDNVAEVSTLVH